MKLQTWGPKVLACRLGTALGVHAAVLLLLHGSRGEPVRTPGLQAARARPTLGPIWGAALQAAPPPPQPTPL